MAAEVRLLKGGICKSQKRSIGDKTVPFDAPGGWGSVAWFNWCPGIGGLAPKGKLLAWERPRKPGEEAATLNDATGAPDCGSPDSLRFKG